jgi:hypothetical protein
METTNATFTLGIGSLGVTANLNKPDLAKNLQNCYRDFPLKGVPRLQVDIRLSGQERNSAIQNTGLVFENGELRFTAPGFEGSIQEREGIGQLSLSSQQPAEDIEYFLRVAYALLAFQAGGVMLHAAGILRTGKAYLFFGHSGSGKTTVSRLSTDDMVLNDDLIILMPNRAGWKVFGTPFWNPTQVKPTPQQAPLAGLFRLVQDRQVYLEKISASTALAELIANVPVIPADLSRTPELIERLKDILVTTPVQRLHFLPDPSFWNIITPQR